MKIDMNVFCLALALLLCPTLTGFGGSWTENGVTFNYTVSDGEACVTIASCDDSASVVIPSEIDGYKVTGVGKTSSGCRTKLASVVIPNGVTSIGSQAFMSCGGLTSMTIPESVRSVDYEAFKNCGRLVSVTIPNSVTNIGSGAFQDCGSLETLTIPGSVVKIGSNAFAGCGELTSLTIMSGVKRIDNSAFWKCGKLMSVDILGGELDIGNSVFADCASLSSLSLHGVTNIGCMAFSRCHSLVTVTIPDGVKAVGSDAFSDCGSLSSVVIPDGLLSLGENAFCGCADNLYDTTTIAGIALIDGWVVGYDSSCAGNVDFTGARGFAVHALSGCSNLAVATIPGSVAHIGSNAFHGCIGLEAIMLLEGISSIGTEAFRDCQKLSSAVIPNSVTNIGYSAFGNCQLAEISIPGGAKLGGAIGGLSMKVVRRQEGEFSILYTNLQGRKTTNPTTYKKGEVLAFEDPYAVAGFTFTEWTPSVIAADRSGTQVVRANWRRNAYQIVYNANGGTGEMPSSDCEYGVAGKLLENAFVREGFVFKGWATENGSGASRA